MSSSISNRTRARVAPNTGRKLQAVRDLLDADAFSRIRTPSELTQLVREESATTDRPYAALLHRLMGLDPDVEEALAKKVWLAAMDHKRNLAQRLGRDVLLRVAMLDLLSTMPELASIRQPVMLSRKLLRRALRETTTDALTGLIRRDEFLPILSHELRQRSTTPPVLAYMDVDGLKALNDRRGHAAGDSVLAGVGQVLARVGREGAAVARIGGDEFAPLFLDCGLTKARACVARIRSEMREGLGDEIGLAVVRAPLVGQRALPEDAARVGLAGLEGGGQRREVTGREELLEAPGESCASAWASRAQCTLSSLRCVGRYRLAPTEDLNSWALAGRSFQRARLSSCLGGDSSGVDADRSLRSRPQSASVQVYGVPLARSNDSCQLT